MSARVISLVIGYLFGCFLTAELVSRKYAGKGAAEIGDTGNPGMANIMAHLGFIPGIITLCGDLLKVILAGLICYGIFRESGWIVVLYAGLGCTLGHLFPFWRHFRGGKGVATISITIALYAFLPGLAANIAGMLVVFATKYLCIGGPVIPLSFLVFMLLRGDVEAAVIAGILSVFSFLAHSRSILGIRTGKTAKNDVLGAIRKKLQGRGRS